MKETMITWKDLCESETAVRLEIDNTPDEESITNLEALIKYIVNPIYAQFPDAEITSGYRCKELNDKIGGVKGSQHTKGQAVDFVMVIPGRTLKQSIQILYRFIVNKLPFDQLIIYPTFVHVSYRAINGRRQIINKAPTIYTDMPSHYLLMPC